MQFYRDLRGELMDRNLQSFVRAPLNLVPCYGCKRTPLGYCKTVSDDYYIRCVCGAKTPICDRIMLAVMQWNSSQEAKKTA